MKLLRSLLAAAGLSLLLPSAALAQCGVTAPGNRVCGNATGSPALATWITVPAGALTPIPGGTVLGNPTGGSAVPIATTAPVLGIPGASTGQIGFAGATSGTALLRAQAAAGSAIVLLPTSAGTIVSTASAPLLINPVTGQVSIVGAAGSVLAGTPPAFTTSPLLGVPGSVGGSLSFGGSSSGTVSIVPQAAAGSGSLFLPTIAGTGTFAVAASAPVVLNAVSGNLTCPTCVTSSGGGAVTGVAPISVSAGGVVSINAPYVSLTASNGGIVYSGPTNLAILAGTATAGQMLRSGATSAPVWTITTWPDTVAISQLLYTSATNAVAGLATANNAVLVTSGTGVPSPYTTLPSGIAATNMNLTTPTLGVASATSINKVAITAPATSATLTIANGVTLSATGANFTLASTGSGSTVTGASAKNLTFNNSLTLAGTDGTTMTFPGTSDTVVTLTAIQTLTNKTLTAPIMTTPQLGVATGTTLALGGAAIGTNNLAVTGSVQVNGPAIITSNSVLAFSVGANGQTNPAFQVNATTASSVTGVVIASQAAAGGVSVGVISSGTNEPMAINAKGNASINLNNVASTGSVTLATGGGGVTIGSALTYGGVTLSNAVTGTGNLVANGIPTLVTPVFSGLPTGSVASANTASTLVARDSSGNFSAGTITAALTGHASLDLALTGGTMTGNIAFSPDTGGIATSTSGSSAAAGVVGADIAVTAGTIAMGNGVPVVLISQAFGAGIWSISCSNIMSFAATTVMQQGAVGTSTTTNFGPVGSLASFSFGATSTIVPNGNFTMVTPETIYKFSGITTVNCIGQIGYSTSTAQSIGSAMKAVKVH